MVKSAVVFFTLLISSLFAHTGANASFTIVEGLLHPIHGFDHILAMFAVGLFASLFAKKDISRVLIAFVSMMMLSAFLATFKLNIPFIEAGIIASIVVFGLMIVFAANISYRIALGAIGIFAMFHGYAHGYEFSGNGSFIGYMAGFSSSTLLIHIAGLMAGMLVKKGTLSSKKSSLLKTAGAMIALTGASFII